MFISKFVNMLTECTHANLRMYLCVCVCVCVCVCECVSAHMCTCCVHMWVCASVYCVGVKFVSSGIAL